MNKADLVVEVGKVVGSKRMADRAISCMFEAIKKGLKKGQAFTFVGFGTFSVSKRKARVGRNPQTGKEIKIPAKRVVKFTPGKALKTLMK
ncbi:MAG: HU family DNA-binding protein [Syntrophaceae bacterium]|nr:HU family DNA-binding protein [Syntrophaceae bacterium]